MSILFMYELYFSSPEIHSEKKVSNFQYGEKVIISATTITVLTLDFASELLLVVG